MREPIWVIDGANVIGSRPDGWWRDRPAAAARLHRRIQRLLTATEPLLDAAGPPERVMLVLEGAARAGVPAGPTTLAARPTPGASPPSLATTSTPTEPSTPPRPTPELTVVHAPASGDDAIVATAAAARARVRVFTSDRGLRARLAEIDARVYGAGALWALLDQVEDRPGETGAPPAP